MVAMDRFSKLAVAGGILMAGAALATLFHRELPWPPTAAPAAPERLEFGRVEGGPPDVSRRAPGCRANR